MRAVKGRVYLSVSGFGGNRQILNLALAIWSNAMRKRSLALLQSSLSSDLVSVARQR